MSTRSMKELIQLKIVKNHEITFLGKKRKRCGHLNKMYTRNGTVHISSPQVHSGKPLKFII